MLKTCWLRFVFSTASFATSPPQDLENRREQLNDLRAEQWEYNLRTSPEYASILGDKRYNDRLSDYSYQFVLSDIEQNKKFLARFEAIATTSFPDQEALNNTLMVRNLRDAGERTFQGVGDACPPELRPAHRLALIGFAAAVRHCEGLRGLHFEAQSDSAATG